MRIACAGLGDTWPEKPGASRHVGPGQHPLLLRISLPALEFTFHFTGGLSASRRARTHHRGSRLLQRGGSGYTYLEDIRLQPKPHITRNIRQIPIDIADAVKDLGCGRGRIGLEAGWLGGMAALRPINDIDRFRTELGDATFVDACDLIWKCRAIKSAREVEALEKATQAVVDAYEEVVSNFRAWA